MVGEKATRNAQKNVPFLLLQAAYVYRACSVPSKAQPAP